MEFADRERAYGREEYYWGTDPNAMAEETAELVSDAADTPTAVDLGAGEGRDAVFFAERGWDVYAIDVSPNGLEKTERLADCHGVTVRTIRGDANHLALPETVDVLYSAGTIQYVRPENRREAFERFKGATASGGVHAMFAFVDCVPTPPDWTENEHFYARGELAGYYEDWDVIRSRAFVFDDDSGGEPHQHAAEVLFARNPN